MEQHPIPQNVSSYQFKLVGDMTLKQFFQLAGGLVVGLIFYSTPLLPIIKWPFAIGSGILGALLAFVPLEERPLERWIFAFFRAIYAPTEFFWKKTINKPKLFQDEPADAGAGVQDAAAQAYLNSTAAQKGGPLGHLEEAEKGFFAKLGGIFSGIGAPPTAAAQPETVAQKPKEMTIPQSVPVKVVPMAPSHLVVEEKPKETTTPENVITSHQVAPLVAGEEFVSTKQAIFSIDAAPPNPPTIPNVVVGQVVDENRKIIEGAIMEIRDSAGRPIRALRSNKAGHFITVTPLDSGRYDVITDKDGYEFTPVSFEANGNLIPPILVSGRSVIAPEPLVNSTMQPTQQPYAN
jgi:hypothetical protein